MTNDSFVTKKSSERERFTRILPSPSSNGVGDLIDYFTEPQEKTFFLRTSPLSRLEKLKKEVDEIYENLKFKVEEGDSALKKCAKVYIIKGIGGMIQTGF